MEIFVIIICFAYGIFGYLIGKIKGKGDVMKEWANGYEQGKEIGKRIGYTQRSLEEKPRRSVKDHCLLNEEDHKKN